MFIHSFLSVLLLTFYITTSLNGICPGNGQSILQTADLNNDSELPGLGDTLTDNKNICNGRLWRNLYYNIKGDAFFLSPEFLSGSVTFNGREFHNLTLKYDIYNDEIILWVNPQTIINLNKEMVDRFTLNYQNRTYDIVNLGDDSTSVVKGLVNVYYDGTATLLVKYKKLINILAVDRKYDLFYEIHRIYVKKDRKIYLVSRRKDLYNILEDKSAEVKAYIRANKLSVVRRDPESFIPVLRYYDSLKR
jgi:hypothetical protein